MCTSNESRKMTNSSLELASRFGEVGRMQKGNWNLEDEDAADSGSGSAEGAEGAPSPRFIITVAALVILTFEESLTSLSDMAQSSPTNS